MTSASVEEAAGCLPRGKLRVAFSGGMDSTVLLHAAARHLQEAGELARLTAHHLDHGLIAASKGMAAHCRRVADALGVDFACDRLQVSVEGNREANARDARYARFEEALAPGETLLLAHHANDQAETLLMRLMRGSGGALLRGMPRERALAKGRLLRPFLHLPRRQLEAYARARRLTWFEDPSNRDLAHDRNYIRHQVLPRLTSRWPQAVGSISRACSAFDKEFAGLDAFALRAAEEVLMDENSLSVEALLALPESVQALVLRRALECMGLLSLSQAHLEEILSQASAPGDRLPEFALRPDLRLARFDGKLVLRRMHETSPARAYAWPLHEDLCLPQGRLVAKCNHAEQGACVAQGLTNLEVRFRRGGERLRVRGVSKKVSRVFQESSVPPWQRAGWPLLYAGDALVCVAGIAVDDAFAEDEGWRIEWLQL